MEFKKLAAGKHNYGSSTNKMEPVEGVANVNFVSPEMTAILRDPKYAGTKKRAKVAHVALFLALSHTVIVEEIKNERKLNASSPDELALVNAAKLFGYDFVGRDADNAVLVLHDGQTEKFQLLNVLEFNSNRKRMSVIVRMPDGRILLMCKGADNMIYDRLSADSKNGEEVRQFLLDCGNEGLRTLALAEREIPEDVYKEWDKGYQEAARAVNGREKKLEEEAEKIEKNMRLLGATAIEDKLQENVGETIDFIKRAGIRFWVLTGDKIETAINIAFSCKLLTNLSVKAVVDCKDSDVVFDKLTKIEQKVILV